QRPAVGEGPRTFGRVEDELDLTVLDSINDVRPTFKHLVDARTWNSIGLEKALRTAGRHDAETEAVEVGDGIEDLRLVAVLDRNENRARCRHCSARRKLALAE